MTRHSVAATGSPRAATALPHARPRVRTDGVRWLIDNAETYDALVDAVAGAQRSVWMTQLAFDADCLVHGDAAAGRADRRLVDSVRAASVERGVDVRILLNESLLLDTATPLRTFLRDAGAPDIRVRGISRFPQLLHAKVVIVDGRDAFIVGSPFVNGYWDDARHRPVDARRPARELGSRPLHDVSFAITGPALGALARTFVELWNEAALDDGAPPLRLSPDTRRAGAVRVVRTAPRRVLPAHPDGVAEILPAIEAGLAAARRLVYIEHQYLSARPVIAALVAALAREPALEVIVVLNQNPDVTAYRGWQNARLREAGLLDHPRVGVFALWSALPHAHGHDVNQVFVHSKVLVVDDQWATVGSANLDGVSLHSYGDDFTGRLGRRVFRHVRNFDVNVVLDDSTDALGGAVSDLRTRLWAEHLGWTDDVVPSRPHGGWVAHWRACAARNVAALRGGGDAPAWRGFVLPYRTEGTPRAQLADLGVPADRVRLHFNPGWLEVHCSPNWVRNMFA